jgi:hypothetical protein
VSINRLTAQPPTRTSWSRSSPKAFATNSTRWTLKLSDAQVESLLSKIAIKSFKTRDEQEVAGYA